MICQFFRGGGLALILVVKGVWQTVAKYTVKVESQGDRNIFQGVRRTAGWSNLPEKSYPVLGLRNIVFSCKFVTLN